jgi:hypothetical protein
VDQSLADGRLPGARVRIRPPCRTARVAFAFSDEPQVARVERDGAPPIDVTPDVVRPDAVYVVGHYRLPAPTARPFTVVFPANSNLNVTGRDVSRRVALEGAHGDPVVRVYCPASGDGTRARFNEVFGPDHWGHHPYGLVRGLPRAWFALGLLALAAGVAWALGVSSRRRGDEARAEADAGS